MKILTITDNPSPSSVSGNHQVIVMPDSSLIKDGKPVFLPSLEREYRLSPFVALRLCKVGKHIAPRFIHRYVNAIAIGVNLIDRQRLTSAKENGLPWAEACTFDASVAISSFIDFNSDSRLIYNITNGETALEKDFSLSEEYRGILSKLSELYTFKIGDLVLLQHSTAENLMTAVKDMNIKGCGYVKSTAPETSDETEEMGSRKILDFNIK
jgi:2-keto-4-pentenoate hydratase/2-oxohepta-3-ene-1,7-dioic acid hydratase in catechol pathway